MMAQGVLRADLAKMESTGVNDDRQDGVYRCPRCGLPDGCVKCRVAVHPNMDFGSVTQKDEQKRYPPY